LTYRELFEKNFPDYGVNELRVLRYLCDEVGRLTEQMRERADAAAVWYEAVVKKIDNGQRASKAALALKEERRAAHKAYRHDYAVGDVLVSSWGYEQTNVDFYKVVVLRGSTQVVLVKVGQDAVENSAGMQGTTTPKPDVVVGAPSKPLRVGPGGYVRMGHRSAHRWDGNPQFWSSYY